MFVIDDKTHSIVSAWFLDSIVTDVRTHSQCTEYGSREDSLTGGGGLANSSALRSPPGDGFGESLDHRRWHGGEVVSMGCDLSAGLGEEVWCI